jgi:hypothetical protein
MLDIVPGMFKSYCIKSFKAQVELMRIVWVEAINWAYKKLKFLKPKFTILVNYLLFVRIHGYEVFVEMHFYFKQCLVRAFMEST